MLARAARKATLWQPTLARECFTAAAPPPTGARGEVDRTGICGATCSHVIPVKEMMLDMRVPEHWALYDALLLELLRCCPGMASGVVYLDLACRYRAHWQKLVDKLVTEGVEWVRPEWRNLRILLPWMHAQGHDHGCQLLNSALYQVRSACAPARLRCFVWTSPRNVLRVSEPLPHRAQIGVGRRVGEQTEALWARIKPVAGLVRYMAQHRRHDTLEGVLHDITCQVQEDFPKLMETLVKHASQQLGACALRFLFIVASLPSNPADLAFQLRVSCAAECTKDLATLEADARKHGVHDCAAALTMLQGEAAGGAAPLSLWAQHAEVSMRLGALGQATINKLGFKMVMSGAAGTQVHAKARDEKLRLRLLTQQAKLARDLGLTPWQSSLDEQQAAAQRAGIAELSQNWVDHLERKVAELAFTRFLVREQRSDETGQNAIKIAKKAASLKR